MIPLRPHEVISVSIFLLALLTLYGWEAVLLVRAALARSRRRPVRPVLTTRAALVVHALAALGIVCMLYGRFVEPFWVEVNVMTIRTPRLRNASFRVVQISDLHCDTAPRNEEEMVRTVNALQPDVIVATGDYLNDAGGISRLKDALGRLEAPLGKFAVTGNFEIYRWPDLDLMQGTGFQYLDRQSRLATKGGESIGIYGLGMGFSDDDEEQCLLRDLPADRFNVFLYHTPDLIERLEGPGVGLYLCGHTHGGQIVLPVYGALVTFSRFKKKYESGAYRVGETLLYVNRGLGLERRPAPQIRFLARPEIAVFDIVPSP
jgi:predicted MPP superfamily phosphohydrolase